MRYVYGFSICTVFNLYEVYRLYRLNYTTHSTTLYRIGKPIELNVRPRDPSVKFTMAAEFKRQDNTRGGLISENIADTFSALAFILIKKIFYPFKFTFFVLKTYEMHG